MHLRLFFLLATLQAQCAFTKRQDDHAAGLQIEDIEGNVAKHSEMDLSLSRKSWLWSSTGTELPGANMNDRAVSDLLGSLVPKGMNGKIDVVAFVEELHGLYFDVNKEPSQQTYWTDYVHFHNWDHGRNVWGFANWYATQKETSLSAEERFYLTLAALAHDVMHPGTPNNKQQVENTFLPVLNKWSGAKGADTSLKEYADDLINTVGLQSSIESIKKSMGCAFKSCGDDASLAQVLMDRAPQEVLHSWVTVELIKKHMPPLVKKLQSIVVPILMTSISAHFAVLFAGPPFPNHDNIAAHVRAEAQSGREYTLGLLIHLFDMGYLCETGLRGLEPNSEQVAVTFGARFLVESNNNGQGLSDWDKVMKGQTDFTAIVSKYLEALGDEKVIPAGDVLDGLKGAVTQLINDDGTGILEKGRGLELQNAIKVVLREGKRLNTTAYNKFEPTSEKLATELQI
jgi:hypothetical protein